MCQIHLQNVFIKEFSVNDVSVLIDFLSEICCYIQLIFRKFYDLSSRETYIYLTNIEVALYKSVTVLTFNITLNVCDIQMANCSRFMLSILKFAKRVIQPFIIHGKNVYAEKWWAMLTVTLQTKHSANSAAY